jgi:adenine phosphoribosyltransferase
MRVAVSRFDPIHSSLRTTLQPLPYPASLLQTYPTLFALSNRTLSPCCPGHPSLLRARYRSCPSAVRQSRPGANPPSRRRLPCLRNFYQFAYLTTDLTLLSPSLSSSLFTMTTQLPPVAPTPSNPATTDHAARLESKPTTSAAGAAELARTKISLHAALRQFPDFPIPGIDFVDILPLFASHSLHTSLIRALELQVLHFNNGIRPDVVVGLDARGFLFGPSLALRLGSSFAPVRKRGKLPGPTKEAPFDKEYGQDFFQIQSDAISKGQTVLVVDDIIATGGSAQAAGKLVEQLGGNLIGYLFILELDFLKGRDKLNAPVVTLLSDEGKSD